MSFPRFSNVSVISHDFPDCHARPFHCPVKSSFDDGLSGSSGEPSLSAVVSGATGADVAMGTDTSFGPTVHEHTKTSASPSLTRPLSLRGAARAPAR